MSGRLELKMSHITFQIFFNVTRLIALTGECVRTDLFLTVAMKDVFRRDLTSSKEKVVTKPQTQRPKYRNLD